jgi:hypothetical protein
MSDQDDLRAAAAATTPSIDQLAAECRQKIIDMEPESIATLIRMLSDHPPEVMASACSGSRSIAECVNLFARFGVAESCRRFAEFVADEIEEMDR